MTMISGVGRHYQTVKESTLNARALSNPSTISEQVEAIFLSVEQYGT